jgi:hypothetical protein
MERPDSITASAVSARESIGLAVAERIRQIQKTKDLEHIAEDVLPQIEKFLESPEERRLRRIRAGLITAAIGLGATIGTLLLALDKSDFLVFMAPTLVIFLVGFGVMINGLWFTLPRKEFPQPTWDSLPQEPAELVQRTATPAYQPLPASSVTEHTTHQLSGGTPNPKVR